MGDTKSKHKFQTLKGLSSCKVETRWMFGHLDVNSDGALSKQELFDLEHDKVKFMRNQSTPTALNLRFVGVFFT